MILTHLTERTCLLLASSLPWNPNWIRQAQGGRDRLAWVRQLVTYTETHPIHVPNQHASAVQVTLRAVHAKAVEKRQDLPDFLLTNRAICDGSSWQDKYARGWPLLMGTHLMCRVLPVAG